MSEEKYPAVWCAEQRRAAEQLRHRLESGEFDTVRFSFADQHGILRGKTLVARAAYEALCSGVQMTATLLAKDTSHKTVFPVFTQEGGGFGFEGMAGAPDFKIIADPLSFKRLPWSPRTGWVLCDAYLLDGQVSPLYTRNILKRAIAQLADAGLELTVGLEVEFHVFRIENENMSLSDAGQPGTPPKVSLLTHGFQYLTEQRYDQVEEVMTLIRTTLQDLGLPVRSLEIEFGPSQLEITLEPMGALQAADAMVLLRSAIKQVCRRHGYLATFMCRPKMPQVMSSGWHLHQSLSALEQRNNVFIPINESAPLSPIGMYYLGGLIEHASAAAVFSTPTINGYRRYRPHSLAPNNATWALDNRAAMLRVLAQIGDPATRIENRIGEPAANPYLYLASQIVSGLDGIKQQRDPGPAADLPYVTQNSPLPQSLSEALLALQKSELFAKFLGQGFVDYYCHLKKAEIERFNLEVTSWEEREYLEMF